MNPLTKKPDCNWKLNSACKDCVYYLVCNPLNLHICKFCDLTSDEEIYNLTNKE
jgi:hypothetical protein